MNNSATSQVIVSHKSYQDYLPTSIRPSNWAEGVRLAM